jgi:nucleotide-binding universal stress UspA family protein
MPVACAIVPWQREFMPESSKRLVHNPGHERKYLVVVDESPEVEAALYFAACRLRNIAGSITLLYVIEPQEYQHWVGVRQVQLEEETNKAKALFRLFRRKLTLAGFDDLVKDEVIREGKTAEEIVKLIEEDRDIGVLVLGAASDTKGPGPLVAMLATGKTAGTFPVPITIVPGNLSLDDVKALA